MKELVILKKPEDTSSLPDLSGLEEVKSIDIRLYSLFVCISVSFISMFLLSWVSKYLSNLGSTPRVYVSVALLVILNIYIWFRLFTGYSVYSTNKSGIEMKGVIRKQFVYWTDIKSFKLYHYYGTVSRLIYVETSGKKYKFEAESVLLASIWQHLRRIGKVDGFVLPESSLNLWAEITDEVPHDLEWISPIKFKPVYMKYLIIVDYICIVASVFYELKIPPAIIRINATQTTQTSFPFIVFIVSVVVIVVTYILCQISQRIVINDSYIEVFYIKGSEKVYWQEISSVCNMQSEIIIKTNIVKREIRIPCAYTNKNSILFILALMRSLRNISGLQPNLIPADTLMAIQKTAKKADV